jgi:hypothetical protein
MGVKPGTLAGLPALSKPSAKASETATRLSRAAATKSVDLPFVVEKWVGQYDREKLGTGVLDLTPDPYDDDRKYVRCLRCLLSAACCMFFAFSCLMPTGFCLLPGLYKDTRFKTSIVLPK